ncbi:MAG TPA: DUF885 domain-containing protein [Candidatus Eisenbacteria bacterium]|nr:DUF885 domain-containing protein [Candidatus Eisenbacteria bacterium]
MSARLQPLVAFVPLLLVIAMPSPARAESPQQKLAKLCDEFWQGYLQANPTRATSLGDKRYDDRLDDITPRGIAREKKRLEDTLARAREFDEHALSPQDRLTRAALVTEVEDNLAWTDCGLYEWTVDPLGGPQVGFMDLAEYTIIESPEDASRYVKRIVAMGPYFDDHIANLRSGKRHKKVAVRAAVEKTLDQLTRIARTPIESLGVWKPATAPHPAWSPAERERFAVDLGKAIQSSLLPGLERYRAFLDKEILPVSRPPERAGLSDLPQGLDCYKRMIHVHTSLDMSPEEIHRLGLEEVAKFRHDLAALGQKVLGTSDVAEIQKRLRTDPAMHFKTSADVEAKARETLARAQAAVPRWFGIQPKAPCEVKVIGMHEAPYTTIAYYREPSADGKRPGAYMIKTYEPETRPRYEAEALAFHESVPGHHLQIAIAQEVKGLPEFRKHQGVTAYVEGWALYTEHLADEMGLYSSDVDRLGMLSFDAWRACRLVVDTGIHSMGWSRQQAIDYMTENSLLASNNIENEVDRYIGWPGQALAYKIGQREILNLRDEAKRRLGARFDIKAFHDAVLENGAVALPVLRQEVEAYIVRAERAQP